MARTKTRKPTLMGLFLRVPLGYTPMAQIYRYGRTNRSPPTLRNISGMANRSKYVFTC